MPRKNAQQVDIGEAKKLGFDPDRLVRLKKAVEKDTERGLYDGAVFLVARGGNIVMHEAVGQTHLASKRTARRDDIFFIMSLTKQLSTVRVLMEIEKGKFQFNTPVAEVLPEFGTKGKQNITVWNILSHTSGLNPEFPFGMTIDKLLSIEGVFSVMCNERLLFRPGRMVNYSPVLAHSIVAVMAQRLDEQKRPFRKMLADDLFGPLGMKNTSLGLPEKLKKNVVPVIVRDTAPGIFDPALLESMSMIISEETEIPSAGAVSTAYDLFLFAEMLRRGGELNGRRILSPEMVKLAVTNQTGTMTNHLFDYLREASGWPEYPAYLGLSFYLKGEGVCPSVFGITTSPRTFGGAGYGSTVFWVDPDRDLTFVFLSAGLMEEAKNILRDQRLSDLVLAAVVD